MKFDNSQIIKEQFDAAIDIYFRLSKVAIIPILTLLYPSNEVLNNLCNKRNGINGAFSSLIKKIEFKCKLNSYTEKQTKQEINKLTNYKNYLKHYKEHLNVISGLDYTEEMVESMLFDTLYLYINYFGFLTFHVKTLYFYFLIKKPDLFQWLDGETKNEEFNKIVLRLKENIKELSIIHRNDFFIYMKENYFIIDNLFN